MNKFVCLLGILLALPVLPAAVFAQQGTPAAAPQTTPAAQPQAPSPAVPQGPPGTLAEMSGYKLTDHEFDLLLQMLPNVSKQALNSEQKKQLIKNWMQIAAFAKEAEAKGLDKDPSVAEQIEMFKKRLLFERYQKELLNPLAVSKEEAQKYFEEHKAQFQTPAQARVSRILVPTKEKADEVRQSIAQGLPFEQVAKEHSTDGASKDKGGDIGWVRPDHKEPDLYRTVQALEPNQISDPFSTPLGWQIVRVTEKRAAVQKEFAEIEKTITQQLLMKKQRETVEASASELSKKYEVKIYEAPK